MVCNVRDEYEISDYDKQAISNLEYSRDFFEAATCAVLTVLERAYGPEAMYLCIDFKEAGISEKELRSWFAMHKEVDAKRKAEERTAQLKKEEREKSRQVALAKLTAYEKALLNLD